MLTTPVAKKSAWATAQDAIARAVESKHTREQRALELARVRKLEERTARAEAAAKALQDGIESELKRQNYYFVADFLRYQTALNKRQPGDPFISMDQFETAIPTPEQWAGMTPFEQNTPGLVRF